MKVTRTENKIVIECESEIETVKFFALALALSVGETESFFPSPSAVLASLDDLAETLHRNRRVVGPTLAEEFPHLIKDIQNEP